MSDKNVYMFLPDGSMRVREKRPFVPLPHGTVLYWNKKWYASLYGDHYVPINECDIPKTARTWRLIAGD